MLEAFDIALLMDNTVTFGGLVKTCDRTKRGIHATLGDGTTATTMPTWDHLNGRFTFDGDDYMSLGNADPNGILSGMGGRPGLEIEDGETYCFYFSPFIAPSSGTYCILSKNTVFASSIKVSIFANVGAKQLNCVWVDDKAGTESISTPINSLPEFAHRSFLFSAVRRSNQQELWFNDGLLYSGTASSKNAVNSAAAEVGRHALSGQYLPGGTGFRFFGYARQAFTQSRFRQLSRGFRSLL